MDPRHGGIITEVQLREEEEHWRKPSGNPGPILSIKKHQPDARGIGSCGALCRVMITTTKKHMQINSWLDWIIHTPTAWQKECTDTIYLNICCPAIHLKLWDTHKNLRKINPFSESNVSNRKSLSYISRCWNYQTENRNIIIVKYVSRKDESHKWIMGEI